MQEKFYVHRLEFLAKREHNMSKACDYRVERIFKFHAAPFSTITWTVITYICVESLSDAFHSVTIFK